MIDIGKIQRKKILYNKITQANRHNSNLRIQFLQKVLDELEAVGALNIPTISLPSQYGNEDRYHESKESFNIDQFNDTLLSLRSDVDSMVEILRMVNSHNHKTERTIEHSMGMIRAGIDKATSKIKSTRLAAGIARFTYREDIQSTEGFDLTNSTASIDTEAQTISISNSMNNSNNITFGRLTYEELEVVSDDEVRTDTSFYDLFSDIHEYNTNIIAQKTSESETSVYITINLRNRPEFKTNRVILNHQSDVTTKIDIISTKDGDRNKIVSNKYMTKGVYTYTFDEINPDKVTFKLTQMNSTEKNNGRFLYNFILKYIHFDYTIAITDQYIQTNVIETDFPITEVSIKSDHRTDNDSIIQYEISNDGESWLPISPSNISPDSPGTLVSFSNKTRYNIDVNEIIDWDEIPRDLTLGINPAINILDNVLDNVDNSSLDIDGIIIDNTLNIYRGIDNYSIIYDEFERDIEVNDVYYRFNMSPDTSGLTIDDDNFQYDIIDKEAFTRIDNEQHTIDKSYRVNVRYNISNNNIRVIDKETNNLVSIDNYSGNIITLNPDTVNKYAQVSVTYHTKISTIEDNDRVIIEVDKNSLRYRNSLNSPYKKDSAIYYDDTNNKIVLNRGTTIPMDGYGIGSVYISFKYNIKSQDKYKLYRTYVYYEGTKTITIFPFTQGEIYSGNFHMIDGNDVSRSKKYVMTPGWHSIITTQPYKTNPDNPNDVNSLTNNNTNAGINITGYSIQRAFNKSLRQVSLHTLLNATPPNDTKSFAIKDNKIYISYTPETLPDSSFLTDATDHLTGNELLCKKAVYKNDNKKTFDYYEEIPEKFTIEFSTEPEEGSEDDIRTCYLRAHLIPNYDTGTSPIIYQIEVLFF